MKHTLLVAIRISGATLILCGIIYPLVITGISQVAFNHQANGSLITNNGKVVGSELIAQDFTREDYFHPRPSAASETSGELVSGASNLGPTSQELSDTYAAQANKVKRENGLAQDAQLPIDAITTSGSGLDPDISVDYAKLQAQRIADSRSIDVAKVKKLIDDNTIGYGIGFLGNQRLNVLRLNLALDGLEK